MSTHQVVRSSRIAGTFRGYRGGWVYELEDGSRWRQESTTHEYLLRTRPAARILTDTTGQYYLDVEGTSNAVRVVPAGSFATDRSGAY